MEKGFSGYYFKHQKGDQMLAVIAGRAKKPFVQLITPGGSYQASPEHCYFSKKGIRLNIDQPGLRVTGGVSYGSFTPIAYDIMGPFSHFNLQCSHKVISMFHTLSGAVTLNGEKLNFSGGRGYLEKDSGSSFPRRYLWLQCNDFSCGTNHKTGCDFSIMLAIADVPFLGTEFTGCICVILLNGKEYRFATYLCVRIMQKNREKIALRQGSRFLSIDIAENDSQVLAAPINGRMNRMIREAPLCPARVRLYERQKLIFDGETKYCSYENLYQ